MLGGTDGERRIVNDALGEPIRLETVKEAEDGEDIQLTLDPVIQREDRSGAGRSRRNVLAEGGDGDRRRPAQLADPGDGELAAGRPRRPLRSQQRRPAQQGDRVHLRAGLDLQGVHRRRRAGGKTGDADDRIHPAADAPGRRPDDRRRRAARHRDDERGDDPRPLLERRRGDDRARGRRRKIQTSGSAASASAARPGSSTRPRSRASCSTSTNTRARRSATCRSARASR